MRLKIYRALLLLPALFVLAGCEMKEVVDDGKVHYPLLRGCLWTPVYHSAGLPALEGIYTDPNYPAYFTDSGRMVVIYRRADMKYAYLADYGYRIGEDSNIITIMTEGGDHLFALHIICETHMTLLYKPAGEEYIAYTRGAFPDEDEIVKETFPESLR